MFESADNFADIFRNGISYYILITIPILLICFSNPILASREYAVQRMSQFDVNGINYGCRASALNLEAKSLYTWTNSRHCVAAKLQDLTIDQFQEIRSKAGGLVILLPENITQLNNDKKQDICLLEQVMISQENTIPIYFSPYNMELEKIIDDITGNTQNIKNNTQQHHNNKKPSVFNDIIQTVSANGYQIFVSGSSHAMNKQSKIPIIQGELAPIVTLKSSVTGDDIELNNKLPLIIIVSHLNTFGLYNEYLWNSDVAATLTIAELFSKLYSSINTAPKYRIMFIITESGSFLNFQGVKKWLDENTQLSKVEFVLCLDSISLPIAKKIESIYMHVSRPPKDNSSISNFFSQLKTVSSKYNEISVEGIHKKINLAEPLLAWEHERFSIKRLPAFTLSTLRTHKDPLRTTVFKDHNKYNLEITQKNTKIIAETLARYIYNIPEEDDGEIFSGAIDITNNLIKSWMQVKSALHNNDLKNAFEKYLKNVKIIMEKPDTRDPDFMLYEGLEATLFVYRVKPAIFDLFLTIVIAAYLGCVYLVVVNFSKFYEYSCKLSKTTPLVKIKSN